MDSINKQIADIAARIRDLREIAELTPEDTAKKLEIPLSEYLVYESGEADIPMSGLFGYCTDLRSMTGGRGDYSYEFARYEQAPSDVQEKEVAARAAKVAENNAED